MTSDDIVVPAHCPADPLLGFVLEAPGDSELTALMRRQLDPNVRIGPAVGPTGHIHDGICRAVGIPRWSQYHGNVINTKLRNNDTRYALVSPAEHIAQLADNPPDSDVLRATVCTPFNKRYVSSAYWHSIALLFDQLTACRPHALVACGGLAAWALTGNGTIASMRSQLGTASRLGIRTWVTYHPAYAFTEFNTRFICEADYRNAWLYANGQSAPGRPVAATSWVPETLAELRALLRVFIVGRPRCAIDIETPYVKRPAAWTRWKRDIIGNIADDSDDSDTDTDALDDVNTSAIDLTAYPWRNDRAEMYIRSVQLCADGANAVVIPFENKQRPMWCHWQLDDHAAAIDAICHAINRPCPDPHAAATQHRAKLIAAYERSIA